MWKKTWLVSVVGGSIALASRGADAQAVAPQGMAPQGMVPQGMVMVPMVPIVVELEEPGADAPPTVTLESPAGQVQCPGLPCQATVPAGRVRIVSEGAIRLRTNVTVPPEPSVLQLQRGSPGRLGGGIALVTTGAVIDISGAVIAAGGLLTMLIGVFILPFSSTAADPWFVAGGATALGGVGLAAIGLAFLAPGIAITATAGAKVRVHPMPQPPTVGFGLVPTQGGALATMGMTF